MCDKVVHDKVVHDKVVYDKAVCERFVCVCEKVVRERLCVTERGAEEEEEKERRDTEPKQEPHTKM